MTLNGAQIHLLFNHVPVVAYPIIAAAILWALVWKESALLNFAAGLTVISGIVTWFAYISGDDAEHVLKQYPDFNKDLVHIHEYNGKYVLILAIFAAAIALAMVPKLRHKIPQLDKKGLQKKLTFALLALSVVISAWSAVTAHQGGIIRHTEIRAQN
jgi:hypothetical protein